MCSRLPFSIDNLNCALPNVLLIVSRPSRMKNHVCGSVVSNPFFLRYEYCYVYMVSLTKGLCVFLQEELFYGK